MHENVADHMDKPQPIFIHIIDIYISLQVIAKGRTIDIFIHEKQARYKLKQSYLKCE